MPVNSRDKGARGERLWRDKCKEYGFDAERTCQNQGNPGEDGDVRVRGMPFDFNHEVKWVEKLNLRGAFQQSLDDCDEDQMPIVAHKKNGQRWLVTMDGDNWFQIMCYVGWMEAIVGELRGNPHWFREDCKEHANYLKRPDA